jgi:uncharacterized protein with GYD domain
VELRDGMADRGKHPLHLVLASLMEDELDTAAAESPRARGRCCTVLELDPVAQLAQGIVAGVALDLGDVRLLDPVARMGEAVRELPVVREQKRARRVCIEPSHGHDARLPRHELHDGRPPLRVAGRGDDAGGLVEEDEPKPLPLHLLAVDLDAVSPAHDGAPARGDPGPGEERVQSHPEKIRGVPHYISLIRWTSQGRMGLPAWRDRVEDGEREIEEAGGKLVGVWVTLGRYDVVEVFEAPDDDTALEIVTKLSHHGAEQTETLRAFTRDEAENIIKKL